jgi:hypothetical protein
MIGSWCFYVRRCWRGVPVEVRCSKGLGASYSGERLTFRSTLVARAALAARTSDPS